MKKPFTAWHLESLGYRPNTENPNLMEHPEQSDTDYFPILLTKDHNLGDSFKAIARAARSNGFNEGINAAKRA